MNVDDDDPGSVPIALHDQEDVVRFRQNVRLVASQLGFSLVEQTKVITAASELARNTVVHGKGGHGTVRVVTIGARSGIRLHFDDQGPGIADIDLALKDGFTSGGGMGLGLGGAKRLSDEFGIVSAPGKGTQVTITKWKR